MLENVNFYSSGDSMDQYFGVNWKWNYIKGEDFPSCYLFACSVPEAKLLENFLIGEDEIKLYINDLMREYLSSKLLANLDLNDVRARLKTFAYDHPANAYTYFQECRLKQHGNIYSDMRIQIPQEHSNDIFYVCVFDDTDIYVRIMIPTSMKNEKVSFSFSKEKLSFFSSVKFLSLKITNRNRNRMVLLRNKIRDTYSVIPENSESYYLDDVVDESSIELLYLSDLIG